MCPFCLTALALTTAGGTTIGAVSIVAARRRSVSRNEDRPKTHDIPKERKQ